MTSEDRSAYQAQLDRITFRPNWKFTLEDFGHGLSVNIVVDLPDSRNPEHTLIPITACVQITCDPEQLPNFVKHLCQSLERHEFDEWWRVDGELVNDPHVEDLVPA